MRHFVFAVLLSLSAAAAPLRFHAEKGARPFELDAPGDWVPSVAPNTFVLKEAGYEPNYPQSISGSASLERDAVQALKALRASGRAQNPPQFEDLKLGTLEALLQRQPGEFTIYAAAGDTQFSIHYVDGRDSMDRHGYQQLLEQIARSFRRL